MFWILALLTSKKKLPLQDVSADIILAVEFTVDELQIIEGPWNGVIIGLQPIGRAVALAFSSITTSPKELVDKISAAVCDGAIAIAIECENECTEEQKQTVIDLQTRVNEPVTSQNCADKRRRLEEWDYSNNPTRFNVAMDYNFDRLPRSGKAVRTPWPGWYWPLVF
jgi:hypothetical protein